MTTIILAGRRIDPPETDVYRFPSVNVDRVRLDILAHFEALKPDWLVCSAACGADLLALQAAEVCGVPRRIIVLPFAPKRFLQTSVLDRPGDWAQPFWAAVGQARAAEDLIVLEEPEGDAAYTAANARIVAEAAAGPPPVRCCIVSEGARRGTGDFTAELADEAARRGWVVDTIGTL